MVVKTFNGNTLDETLKAIKKELGPDAIILKTITNKGIKGALKKNRIEITAAISKKEYEKKIKVDHVLPPSEKEKFYKNSASQMSQTIQDYSKNNFDDSASPNASGYGKLALNKRVMTVKDETHAASMSSGLDLFLKENQNPIQNMLVNTEVKNETRMTPNIHFTPSAHNNVENLPDEKLQVLEKQVRELQQQLQLLIEKKPLGLWKLSNYLNTLGLDDDFIQEIMKKALQDLKKEDLEDFDSLYDFALREMDEHIHIEAPLFSSLQMQGKPVVTLLISNLSCGQTTMLYKLGTLKSELNLISVIKDTSFIKKKDDTLKKILKLKAKDVTSYQEIFSETKKAIGSGQSVVIDYRQLHENFSNRKFVEDIKKSFEYVEVLVCLSSVHHPKIGRRQLEEYCDLADGVTFTHLDICANYAEIFNLHRSYSHIPLKFFGTGPLIPDDIESATKERLIAGICKL